MTSHPLSGTKRSDIGSPRGPRWRRLGALALLVLAAWVAPGLSPGVAQGPPAPPSGPETETETEPPSADGGPTATGAAGVAPLAPIQAPTQNQPIGISSGRKIAIVPVTGMIYGYTVESIDSRIQKAIDEGCDLIVLEIETNGGLVDSALSISRNLKGLPGNVQTVAWVNNKAISAGILIASACDRIVMAPAAQAGDCAPIVPGQELAPTERAKAFSPIAAEFKDSAARNGYDYPLFHAMCVLGVEVYFVQRKDDPAVRRLVNQTDYEIMVKGVVPPGGFLPIKFNTAGPGNNPGAAPAGAPGGNPAGGAGAPGAGPTGLNPFDVVSRSDFVDPVLDRGKWEPVTLAGGISFPEGRVHDGLTLLTIDDRRAEAIGLSSGTVADAPALQQKYQAASFTLYAPSWVARASYFLTHPLARAALVLLLIIGVYIELQSPGLGVGGAIALIAAVMLFGAPYMVGIAQVWHILLFAVGLVLLIIELAFTPTFGLLGVGGIAAMVVGLVLTVIPAFTQSSGGGTYSDPAAWDQLLVSSITVVSSIVVAAVALGLMGAKFEKIRAFQALVLTDEPPRQDGDEAFDPATQLAEPSWAGGPGVAVGDEGRASSPLHPGGSATFEGHDEPVDVVSVAGVIDAGDKVRVVEVAGYRVVVERA